MFDDSEMIRSMSMGPVVKFWWDGRDWFPVDVPFKCIGSSGRIRREPTGWSGRIGYASTSGAMWPITSVYLSPKTKNFTHLMIMNSIYFLDSAALTGLIVLSVGVLVTWYYTTKTDIPKIRGIPEIPGALPMYYRWQSKGANKSFGHLLQLGDVLQLNQ